MSEQDVVQNWFSSVAGKLDQEPAPQVDATPSHGSGNVYESLADIERGAALEEQAQPPQLDEEHEDLLYERTGLDSESWLETYKGPSTPSWQRRLILL
jgi:hypothetical protein